MGRGWNNRSKVFKATPETLAESRAKLDPVKGTVADAVAHHVITDPNLRPPLRPQPDAIQGVEAYPINALETTIRVNLADGKVRWFYVKVGEMMSS